MTRTVAITLALLALVGGCDSSDRGPCAVGERGCACNPLGECGEALVCHSQTCVSTHHADVRVNAAGARACEVLFQEHTSVIADVTFASGVRGSQARRGSKASIAFISESDTDLHGNGVQVQWLGNTNDADIEVLESECFDRLGQSIAGSSVSLR